MILMIASEKRYYDVVVVGSEPAGRTVSLQSAKPLLRSPSFPTVCEVWIRLLENFEL